MRVEAGLSDQYTAAAMVLVICGRVVSVSTRAELTNVHSVPSATGSCAEDGDLVAGAIGGAEQMTGSRQECTCTPPPHLANTL